MNEAYMSQNLEQLEKDFKQKLNNASDLLPEEWAVLLDNRNLNWVQNMPTIMNDKSTLFAVGAGHLIGEKGLLNLLKKQGYTVEAVN